MVNNSVMSSAITISKADLTTVQQMFHTFSRMVTKRTSRVVIPVPNKREISKSDINNIELDTFHNIFLSVLNEHAPLKQKHLRANHGSFVTKELRKAIMKRSRLRNVYLQYRTEISKIAYNKQRNICVSLLKKSKRSYFGNLDVQTMTDNKKFWKRVSPLFSNKIKTKEKITLVENREIVSIDSEVASIFNEFFTTIVKKSKHL